MVMKWKDEEVPIDPTEAEIVKQLETKLRITLPILQRRNLGFSGIGVKDTHVTKLRIQEKVVEELPEDILQLPHLKKLVVSECHLKVVPDWIGSLTNLTELILDTNEIEKLPESILKLTELELLWVDANNLHHLPEDIGNLSKLRKIAIRFNPIEKIPPSITKLTNLRQLLILNDQKDLITPEIQNMPGLVILKMAG